MASKTIFVSDFTAKQIASEKQAATITVRLATVARPSSSPIVTSMTRSSLRSPRSVVSRPSVVGGRRSRVSVPCREARPSLLWKSFVSS